MSIFIGLRFGALSTLVSEDIRNHHYSRLKQLSKNLVILILIEKYQYECAIRLLAVFKMSNPVTMNTQTVFSKYHFQLKGTQVPERNGWIQV